MAKSILKQMSKIFKSTGDKVWFAFFVPTTIYGYLNHGVKPLWLAATVLGIAYISMRVYEAFKD